MKMYPIMISLYLIVVSKLLTLLVYKIGFAIIYILIPIFLYVFIAKLIISIFIILFILHLLILYHNPLLHFTHIFTFSLILSSFFLPLLSSHSSFFIIKHFLYVKCPTIIHRQLHRLFHFRFYCRFHFYLRFTHRKFIL